MIGDAANLRLINLTFGYSMLPADAASGLVEPLEPLLTQVLTLIINNRFICKGLYNIETSENVCGEKFPENTIISHNCLIWLNYKY